MVMKIVKAAFNVHSDDRDEPFLAVSEAYVPYDDLPALNKMLDAALAREGRSRRDYEVTSVRYFDKDFKAWVNASLNDHHVHLRQYKVHLKKTMKMDEAKEEVEAPKETIERLTQENDALKNRITELEAAGAPRTNVVVTAIGFLAAAICLWLYEKRTTEDQPGAEHRSTEVNSDRIASEGVRRQPTAPLENVD